MKIYSDTKYKDFIHIANTINISEQDINTLMDKASKIAVPDEFKFDYNQLTFGQLCALQGMKTGGDVLTKAPFIILEGTEKKFFKQPVLSALSFISNMNKELERISNAFKSIEYKPSKEEIKAGIKEVNNSMHNIADWYAIRMGIQDVNEVYNIKWTIIWSAMRIENQNAELRRKMFQQQQKAGNKK